MHYHKFKEKTGWFSLQFDDLQPKYEFPLMISGVSQIYSYFWQCRQCPPFNSLGTGGWEGDGGICQKILNLPPKSGKSGKHTSNLWRRERWGVDIYGDIHRYVGDFGEILEILMEILRFAVHPVHTEAVTGVVGRAELLCRYSSHHQYHKAFFTPSTSPENLDGNSIVVFECNLRCFGSKLILQEKETEKQIIEVLGLKSPWFTHFFFLIWLTTLCQRKHFFSIFFLSTLLQYGRGARQSRVSIWFDKHNLQIVAS